MPWKQPISVLVLVHTSDLQVLLLERADFPGHWQSVTGSRDDDEVLATTATRELAEETGIDAHRCGIGNETGPSERSNNSGGTGGDKRFFQAIDARSKKWKGRIEKNLTGYRPRARNRRILPIGRHPMQKQSGRDNLAKGNMLCVR